ncbi:hypothetical protein [Elizabethkingia anophelis]|uniref:hypothetical protein n=1 Tax=Elizabethkingia anophelis TaxID=1117645 RepID=UPI0020113F7F|nr:hypothetical protein [Elizabethkingia anophelis]MCL1689633.1 hypothetical protein [Elizabethkingia anophelis]
MNKSILLFVVIILFFTGCSNRDEKCWQRWQVKEWETTESGYGCIASESNPIFNEKMYKCEEGIKEGQEVVYMTVGCKKFRRKYIKRVN